MAPARLDALLLTYRGIMRQALLFVEALEPTKADTEMAQFYTRAAMDEIRKINGMKPEGGGK